MKILSVVHGCPPEAEGGTELYAAAQARVFSERHRDEVLVLAREDDRSRPDYAVRREPRDGLTIVRINNTFRDSRSFEDTYRSEAIARLAGDVIDEFGPEIAHVHHLTGLGTDVVTALASRRVPMVMTLHDYWLLCHRGQLLDADLQRCAGPEPDGCERCVGLAGAVGRSGHAAAGLVRGLERHVPAAIGAAVRRTAERAAAQVADRNAAAGAARRRFHHMRETCDAITHFLAPSEFVRSRFLEFGLDAERLSTAVLGIDTTPFRRTTPRPVSAPLRLGFLGALMVSKAPHLALEAFGQLAAGTATLDVYGGNAAYHGDDSYRALLEPMLAADGVRARGVVPHDEVPRALADLDVLVVPSVWPETTGLVIKEAFAAGVVVVASRIGGMPEAVLDGVDGLLFTPGDAADLSRTLKRLVDEPDLLTVLRGNAPSVRTIEADVESTRQIYREVIARASAGSRATSATAPPRTVAIVLNYKTPDETVLAVRSLLASRRPLDEIIVVDNDASDACRQALSALGDRVRYVWAGENLGFSGGMNAGVADARARGADRILFVNSDVIVPPDCVGGLERVLESTSDIGIVGPLVMSRAAPDVVSSAGLAYHVGSGRMKKVGSGRTIANWMLPVTGEVAAVSGCLMLVRADMFETVGGFDDEFFFSFEEIDLCFRARRAGFKTALVATVRAYHEGSRSIGARSPLRLYYAARNHQRLARHASPEAGRVTALARGIWIFGLYLAHAVRAPGGTVFSRFGAVLRGTRDYARGRFGKA